MDSDTHYALCSAQVDLEGSETYDIVLCEQACERMRVMGSRELAPPRLIKEYRKSRQRPTPHNDQLMNILYILYIYRSKESLHSTPCRKLPAYSRAWPCCLVFPTPSLSAEPPVLVGGHPLHRPGHVR